MPLLTAAILVVASSVSAEHPAPAPHEGAPVRVLELAGAHGSDAAPARRASLAELAYAAPRLTASELHSAGPLDSSERARLHPALAAGELHRVGISRSFASPVGFDLSVRQSLPVAGERLGGGLFERNDDQLVWTAGFESPGAGAVRLRLEQVDLPAGTAGWVYSRTGEVHGPYDLGGAQAGPFWSNTVFSSTVFLELHLPRGTRAGAEAHLRVAAIEHLESREFAPPPSAGSLDEALPDCFRDVRCAGGEELAHLEEATHAIALLVFERDGSSYVCSGALVNTTEGTEIPYVLTANHCVNSAATAKSVEFFWDYRTATCAGQVPDRSVFSRSLGASLLATGAIEAGEPDFSLLRLSQPPPAGRYYLGWSAAAVIGQGGTEIFRIAHPEGGPQMFSMHSVSEVPTPGECANLPRSSFIYSKNVIGATKGGSSGSPAFLADGLKIVGQLYGRCGNNLPDSCDAAQNSAVDGAFASYFAKVERWLAPPDVEPCVPGTANLCLLDTRFRVTVSARDARTGERTSGIALAENDMFGYFSLPAITGQAGNPEIFVKMLDARNLSGRFWVFYGGLTDLEFTLTVTDTATGAVKSYTKPAGSYCGDADTQAF
ncbi:MAG: trypsin-like peptidase domain-containing protein [Acidobacteria bacterium]|nr:trypsin-like peptidase domain-containing protein [Acidobacteriota bacterium]